MDSKPGDKIRLFATIEPFNLKLGLCFNADSLVSEIHHFVDETMKKLKIRFRTGRVDYHGSWIMPQYRISDLLEDKSNITIYSVEYGLTLTSLAGEYADLRIPTSNISLLLDQDVNQKFIGKKTNRDKQKKPFNPKEGETVENEDVLTPPFETPKEIKPKENKPAASTPKSQVNKEGSASKQNPNSTKQSKGHKNEEKKQETQQQSKKENVKNREESDVDEDASSDSGNEGGEDLPIPAKKKEKTF